MLMLTCSSPGGRMGIPERGAAARPLSDVIAGEGNEVLQAVARSVRVHRRGADRVWGGGAVDRRTPQGASGTVVNRMG